jgi:hypothetical protein
MAELLSLAIYPYLQEIHGSKLMFATHQTTML